MSKKIILTLLLGLACSSSYAEIDINLQGAAESGDLKAQLALAAQFESLPNYYEAVYWYKKAANKGNSFAQEKLKYFLDKKLGVPSEYFAKCKDINFDSREYIDSILPQLINGTGLTYEYVDKYEAGIPYSLCRGKYIKELDNDVDNGLISPKKVTDVARRLGLVYKAKLQSEQGKRYQKSYAVFFNLDALNMAERGGLAYLYSQKPNSRCGKIAIKVFNSKSISEAQRQELSRPCS